MVKENGALSDTSAVERIRKASTRGNAKSRRKNVISRDSFKGKNFLIFKFLAGQHDRTARLKSRHKARWDLLPLVHEEGQDTRLTSRGQSALHRPVLADRLQEFGDTRRGTI